MNYNSFNVIYDRNKNDIGNCNCNDKKLVGIILGYYNQGFDVLSKHLDLWLGYDKEILDSFRFIIIDDCSVDDKKLLGKDFSDYLGKLDIQLYRVLDDLYCNICGGRNLGALVCNCEWMLILDMDCLVGLDMARAVYNICSGKVGVGNKGGFGGEGIKGVSGICYKFNRRTKDTKHIKNGKIHPAVCLLKVADYFKVGGCEEDLVGSYGYTDPCFWFRARGILRIIELSEVYIDYIDEGEADINRNNLRNRVIYNSIVLGKRGWSNKYIRFRWVKEKI